uniref:F-box/FBD/LRR-repeat protein At1g13570-like n=1 Tax=Erigeron canadensis TaxID=72917 RepID=UPI001CB8C9E2|nr:F-box/FBD/LRR-repeat protein At1g13570-like [Erigeron canadensis]
MFDEVDTDGPDKLEYPLNESKELVRKYKIFSAIQHVLLVHQGPIVEFTLDMQANYTCTEIDLIIRYLSKNKTVKKFALELNDPRNDFYRLPLSFFSLNQLADLTLQVCELEFDPRSSGFSSLTSLSMTCVKTSMKTVLHLLSSCPLLKSLNLILFIEDLDGSGLQVDMIELFKC